MPQVECELHETLSPSLVNVRLVVGIHLLRENNMNICSLRNALMINSGGIFSLVPTIRSVPRNIWQGNKCMILDEILLRSELLCHGNFRMKIRVD